MRKVYIYKLVAFLVFLMFLSHHSSGQIKQDYLIYSSLKGNLGNYYGGGITLDLIHKNKYSFGVGFYEHVKKTGNLPSDYKKGVLSLLTLGEGVARDNIQSLSLTLGRVFLSKSNSGIRYNLKAGVTYSVSKTPSNWIKLNEGGGLFSMENYSYNYKKYREIGILINPTIDIPLFKFLGFSVGPYSFLNLKTISCGIELTTLIGCVKR